MTTLTGRRPKLTPEQVRALRRWAALGTSISGVARTLGVSRGTLRRYLALAAGVALLPSGVPALPLAIRERIAAWLRAQEPPR